MNRLTTWDAWKWVARYGRTALLSGWAKAVHEQTS